MRASLLILQLEQVVTSTNRSLSLVFPAPKQITYLMK